MQTAMLTTTLSENWNFLFFSHCLGPGCSKGRESYPSDKSLNPVDSVVCFVNTYPSDSDLYTVKSIIQPLNSWG